MFENVDGRWTPESLVYILLAHLGALGSGELKLGNPPALNKHCPHLRWYSQFSYKIYDPSVGKQGEFYQGFDC